MATTDRDADTVRCGQRFEPPSPGILQLDGDFPTTVSVDRQVVVGRVEVTAIGEVHGVAPAAADVVLVRDCRVVATPLPRDAMGIRWDLDPGGATTLPAAGSLVSCGPPEGPLAPGSYDLHVLLAVVLDGATSPRVFGGGPWPLRVS